jgi:hypothetical protein
MGRRDNGCMAQCGDVVGRGGAGQCGGVGPQWVETCGCGTTVGRERVSMVPRGDLEGRGCVPWCVTGATSLHSHHTWQVRGGSEVVTTQCEGGQGHSGSWHGGGGGDVAGMLMDGLKKM